MVKIKYVKNKMSSIRLAPRLMLITFLVSASLSCFISPVLAGCIAYFKADTYTLSADGNSSTLLRFKIFCPGSCTFGFGSNDLDCKIIGRCGTIDCMGGGGNEDVELLARYTAPKIEPTEELSGTVEVLIQLKHSGGNTMGIYMTLDIGEYVPPVPTASITIKTDKDTYEQGEAVTIEGGFFYKDESTAPYKQKLSIEVEVPNCQAPKQGRIIGINTYEDGQYSIMPFAGWNIGEYKLRVYGKVFIESEKKYIEANNETSFQVVEAEPGLMCGYSFNQIIQRYKSQVPEGPIRKNPPSMWPESMYGSYHNLRLAGTSVDPKSNFVCGGYQSQVLKFFDSLRFNKDPSVRKLLKGLDYGPIARGMWILGGHHAVVLYPIGKEWCQLGYVPPEEAAYVFDPWPKQKPKTCDVVEFSGGMGFVRADGIHKADPNDIYTGYPLTGQVVYVNYEGGVGERKKPVAPKSSVVVKCPVDVLIADSQGKRIGMLPDGNFVQEFSALVYRATEDDKSLGWYFGLPEGVYSTVITGKSTGTFRLLVSGEVAGGQVLDYDSQSITERAEAHITLDPENPSAPLILPDGREVLPEVIPIELGIQFNFDDGRAQNWTDDGSGCWSVSDGVYVMTGNKENACRYSCYNQEFSDFTYQADVRKVAGDSSDYAYGYGLYIRGDGTQNNYYEFIIVVYGQYVIGKSVEGEFTKLVDWKTSDTLKTGYNQWNTLKVIAEGSTFKFYANGTHLTTVEDTTFSCGKIGVFAINAASSTKPDIVQFDNVSLVSLQIPDTHDGGYYVTSDLWIRAVINTEEKGPIEAVWKKGGEDTTSRGDRVIWGHFYASPNDVTWGSENNPDLFVKIWFDVSGRVDVNYFHVSVPEITVYSDYPYDGTVDEQGTTTMDRRYIRQYYENGQSYMDENYEDGNPPAGYLPTGNPSGYSTINDLRIGAIINTVEKGGIDAIWQLGGQDTTSRGDQVVWGHFYASPSDVTWGSQNNPDLFVKIWFDVSGRTDVNFFHVSVPDIEVYSDLPDAGAYDQKGTTIMDNRYIRHEYWR